MFIIGPLASLLVICFMAPRDEMPPVVPEIARARRDRPQPDQWFVEPKRSGDVPAQSSLA
jgi:hypothetical protein